MIKLLRFILGLFTAEKTNPAATVSLVLSSGYNADKPIQRVADVQLTEHFSLWELTITANAALQSANRILSDTLVQKANRLARHGEAIRKICGGRAVNVHSGFRCDLLNGSTAGSSKTSQHPKMEAIDFDVSGMELEDVFNLLRAEAIAGRFYFGQLIFECAKRDYGVSRWIHCSVPGTLDPSKIGQVLTMKEEGGVYKYELLEQIKFHGLTLP